MNYCIYQTKIGPIGIAEQNGLLTNIWFEVTLPVQLTAIFSCDTTLLIQNETPLLVEAKKQISLYLNGITTAFSLPLQAQGTPFMCSVWDELCKIPYGHTVSYFDIACSLGNKKAVRAVGMANHKNPLPIIIPCHRVIGKNGKLTGYAGGLDIKQKLLDIEAFTLSRQVHLL